LSDLGVSRDEAEILDVSNAMARQGSVIRPKNVVPNWLPLTTFTAENIDKTRYILRIECPHVVFRELECVKGDAGRPSISKSSLFFGFGIFNPSSAVPHGGVRVMYN
jgi:hypothetical protein